MKRPDCVIAILDWDKRRLDGLLQKDPSAVNDALIDADEQHDPHDSIDEVEQEHDGIEVAPVDAPATEPAVQ